MNMAPRRVYPIPDLNESLKPENHIRLNRVSLANQQPRLKRPEEFDNEGLGVETNSILDKLWHFEHVLGTGAFGLVGLWVRRDAYNNIVDTMAVKDAFMTTRDMYQLDVDGPDIPGEALIQTALQKKECVPIVQLRGLKVMTAGLHRARLRHYLEYCPHGDLWEVLDAYYEYLSAHPTSDERVPESFLWQLFHSFSQVMLAMEHGPFDHPQNDPSIDDMFILHLDVKTRNVMLGEPDDDAAITAYPSCKVGDWGLAVLTHPSDPRNSSEFYLSGTTDWLPPEQYRLNRFGAFWQRKPPWHHYSIWGEHRYTTAHSVFAFASIIFRLMVLDRSRQQLNNLLDLANLHEAAVFDKQFKFIVKSDMDYNVHGQLTGYSAFLKDTIAYCLNIDPARRPSATLLSRLTQDMCTHYAALQSQDGVDHFPPLRTTAHATESDDGIL